MLDILKVGNTISVCRKDKGYTQDELASRLGVTPQAVSKWERGTSLPDTDMLPGLSKMLNISVDELLMGIAPPKETLQITAEKSANIVNDSEIILRSLLPSEILIEISTSLCIDNQPFLDEFLSDIAFLRRKIAYEYGFLLPLVQLRDNACLADGEYAIAFRKKNYGSGHIFRGLLFTYTNDTLLKGIPASDFKGSHILWVADNEQNKAVNLPFFNGTKMIINHLNELVLQYPDIIITRQMVKVIVENLAEQHPVLVSDIVPTRIGYGKLRDLLVGIIKEKKPINDMVTILETIDKLMNEKTVYEDMMKELVGIL